VPGERKDVYMGATRRRFTLEYRIEAAHRVIDSNRSVAEVARDLSLVEATLARWVREERRRVAAATNTVRPLSVQLSEQSYFGCARRSLNRRKTPPSWEKQLRTSQPIHQSRAVRVDGSGVRQF